LTSGAEATLDALYKTVLKSTVVWDDPDFVTDIHTILGTMLVACIPLSGTAINKLLGIDERQPSVHTTLALCCVIHQQPTLHFLYPLFANFLSD
jgi:hypothetical protein